MKRQGYRFAPLPAKWIRDGDLSQFGAGERGRAVTALKLYVAILAATRGDNADPGIGRAKLTFNQMEEVTGAARAMISPALGFLEPWVQTVERSRRGNVYEIRGYTTHPGAWVRLPSEYILSRKLLPRVPSRSRTSVNALKLYLYLLERCERGSNVARPSYERIRERTGILQNDIHQAIFLLNELRLISLGPAEERWKDRSGVNVYKLLGLGTREPEELVEADVVF